LDEGVEHSFRFNEFLIESVVFFDVEVFQITGEQQVVFRFAY